MLENAAFAQLKARGLKRTSSGYLLARPGRLLLSRFMNREIRMDLRAVCLFGGATALQKNTLG